MKKLLVVALALVMGMAISTTTFAGGDKCKGKKECGDKKECCNKDTKKMSKKSHCCKDGDGKAHSEKEPKMDNSKDMKKAN